jgi:hypothetical protein
LGLKKWGYIAAGAVVVAVAVVGLAVGVFGVGKSSGAQAKAGETPTVTPSGASGPGFAGRGLGQRGGSGPGVGFGGGFGGLANVVDSAAGAIGISSSDLTTALRNGESVAQVASDHGVSLDTVKTAVLKAEQTQLAQAVSDERITQAQANQLSQNLSSRIDQMLNNTSAFAGGPNGGGPNGASGANGRGFGGRGFRGGVGQGGPMGSTGQ